MPDKVTHEQNNFSVHIGSEKWHQAAAFYVRLDVFVLEREIALADEFDADDHDDMIYIVIYDGKKPVATGRFIQEDETTIRPGRIAVLKDYRGRGLGERIIHEMEDYSKNNGCTKSVIHGELSAAGFYEKIGYNRTSDVYEEDGVPCVTLKKALESIS
ncbi:GNAT family N-acetyltransferase [Alkalibacterium sp.]|nr:MAG: N-acetyltransferase [Alkalibacterium sp.]